jgi:K+ transporter
MVVAVKYVSLVMRADNKGEGGIMALMTLAQRAVGQSTHAQAGGVDGAARRGAVFGDG